jgi:hypothetical protein
MRAPVAHINLLERSGPAHWVAWATAGSFALSVLGAVIYGVHVRGAAEAAVRQRDDVAAQITQVQARMAALNGEKTKSAGAQSLRGELDALQPQMQAARALSSAVGGALGGKSEEFSRTLHLVGTVSEPGLWLTTMNVSAGGKRLEVQGEARSAAAVLKYAQRANEALKPLLLRLDNLELQPANAANAAYASAGGAPPGTVSFRLN